MTKKEKSQEKLLSLQRRGSMTTWQLRFFRVGCTSHLARACFNTVGQLVAQTDSDWDGGEKKGSDEENSPKSASVVSLGLHKAGQYMSQYMSINASLIYLKLSSCRWVSRLQQSINGKKKKHILLFFSSLLLQPPPPACETHSWISKQTEEEWNKVGWGRKKSVW